MTAGEFAQHLKAVKSGTGWAALALARAIGFLKRDMAGGRA